jgi:hypothetical protein
MSRTLLRGRTFDSGLFRRVHELKALIGGRLVAMRTGCGRTALGNLRSVRPKRIVKKSVGLRFNFNMAEYSIAVPAVQSPLRHSITLWRGAGLRCHHNAKIQHMRMFHTEHKLYCMPGLNSIDSFSYGQGWFHRSTTETRGDCIRTKEREGPGPQKNAPKRNGPIGSRGAANQ